jgi:hypothetical protein
MLFGKSKIQKTAIKGPFPIADPLFDGVPGPSPWYFSPDTPATKGFRWQRAGDAPPAAGKTLLIGNHGPVAVLNFYNYAIVLDESTILIWHQGQSSYDASPTPPVRLFVIEPNRLSPFSKDLSTLYEKMNTQKERVALGGSPLALTSLLTTNIEDEMSTKFPAQLETLDELLILCDSSGIRSEPTWNLGNLALLVAKPSQSKYRLYPQDWFNEGGLDYGYQWVSRVVRNRQTGHIHGQGIRIGPFILDDSLRRQVRT